MTKPPRIKGQELITALHRAGFEVIRAKGSYHFYAILMDVVPLSLFIAEKQLDQG